MKGDLNTNSNGISESLSVSSPLIDSGFVKDSTGKNVEWWQTTSEAKRTKEAKINKEKQPSCTVKRPIEYAKVEEYGPGRIKPSLTKDGYGLWNRTKSRRARKEIEKADAHRSASHFF